MGARRSTNSDDPRGDKATRFEGRGLFWDQEHRTIPGCTPNGTESTQEGGKVFHYRALNTVNSPEGRGGVWAGVFPGGYNRAQRITG